MNPLLIFPLWIPFQSYRIMTPPSAEKGARWGTSTMELDFKSDSSDQTDLLVSSSIIGCVVPLSGENTQSDMSHH